MDYNVTLNSVAIVILKKRVGEGTHSIILVNGLRGKGAHQKIRESSALRRFPVL